MTSAQMKLLANTAQIKSLLFKNKEILKKKEESQAELRASNNNYFDEETKKIVQETLDGHLQTMKETIQTLENKLIATREMLDVLQEYSNKIIEIETGNFFERSIVFCFS